MVRPGARARVAGVLSTRPATADDDRALQRLEVLTMTGEVSPGPARSPDDPFFGRGRQPGDVLVAEDGGALVGYVGVEQEYGAASHAHVLTISGLAVDPGVQRRGIGRALLELGIARARERGARKLSLRVLGPNARARSLYESCGFVVEGVLRAEFVIEGREVDDVVMARHLS